MASTQNWSDSKLLSILDSHYSPEILKAPVIHKTGDKFKFQDKKRKLMRGIFSEKSNISGIPKKWEIEYYRRKDKKVVVSNAVSIGSMLIIF